MCAVSAVAVVVLRGYRVAPAGFAVRGLPQLNDLLTEFLEFLLNLLLEFVV